MSSIPQNHSDEKALIDCVQRFFSKHVTVQRSTGLEKTDGVD